MARLRGDRGAALEHLQTLVNSTDTSPKWQRERMRGWVQMGWLQLENGSPAEAVASFERALKELARLESGQTPTLADAQLGLARAQQATSKLLPTQAGPKN